MILKPTMAEHLGGIAAGLESVMPNLDGPDRRQVLLAMMFLKRLAKRAGRFDAVLREDTFDLEDSLSSLLNLFEAEGTDAPRLAELRAAFTELATAGAPGARECPSADAFVARNLEFQSLLSWAQTLVAALPRGATAEAADRMLRACHERSVARDLALLDPGRSD